MIDGEKQKILKKFGKRLNNVRESRGMSLRELAAASGLEHAQIARIENGEKNPTLYTVIRLAEALDIFPGELFTS